jgi:hypothetical protein
MKSTWLMASGEADYLQYTLAPVLRWLGSALLMMDQFYSH